LAKAQFQPDQVLNLETYTLGYLGSMALESDMVDGLDALTLQKLAYGKYNAEQMNWGAYRFKGSGPGGAWSPYDLTPTEKPRHDGGRNDVSGLNPATLVRQLAEQQYNPGQVNNKYCGGG
jgi:hypothetical protein